jgi:hypothetical protein
LIAIEMVASVAVDKIRKRLCFEDIVGLVASVVNYDVETGGMGVIE